MNWKTREEFNQKIKSIESQALPEEAKKVIISLLDLIKMLNDEIIRIDNNSYPQGYGR